MSEASRLSDKALAVLAFAAYHQLESGQAVTKVVRQDGKGHEADGQAVRELEEAGFVRGGENEIVFTESGLPLLAAAIDGLRRSTQSV